MSGFAAELEKVKISLPCTSLEIWFQDEARIGQKNKFTTRRGHTKGFEVLPRRWMVEHTFAWIFKNRRLVRNYEQLTAVAETLITIAASATLLRRWA